MTTVYAAHHLPSADDPPEAFGPVVAWLLALSGQPCVPARC